MNIESKTQNEARKQARIRPLEFACVFTFTVVSIVYLYPSYDSENFFTSFHYNSYTTPEIYSADNATAYTVHTPMNALILQRFTQNNKVIFYMRKAAIFVLLIGCAACLAHFFTQPQRQYQGKQVLFPLTYPEFLRDSKNKIQQYRRGLRIWYKLMFLIVFLLFSFEILVSYVDKNYSLPYDQKNNCQQNCLPISKSIFKFNLIPDTTSICYLDLQASVGQINQNKCMLSTTFQSLCNNLSLLNSFQISVQEYIFSPINQSYSSFNVYNIFPNEQDSCFHSFLLFKQGNPINSYIPLGINTSQIVASDSFKNAIFKDRYNADIYIFLGLNIYYYQALQKYFQCTSSTKLRQGLFLKNGYNFTRRCEDVVQDIFGSFNGMQQLFVLTILLLLFQIYNFFACICECRNQKQEFDQNSFPKFT